ncbi:hypothetical protein [Methylobacter sp. BlB1]|uniref:hypothetical protein n=1 Tax=Methylobacter sp. BlB1 TaxID=2785914 RepID=UPI001895FFAA|nr:hypothetical protein [Methylobacter sp. BlB1]
MSWQYRQTPAQEQNNTKMANDGTIIIYVKAIVLQGLCLILIIMPSSCRTVRSETPIQQLRLNQQQPSQSKTDCLIRICLDLSSFIMIGMKTA